MDRLRDRLRAACARIQLGMPNTGSPSLAVIVPATDRPPTLDRCLAALRASTEPPDELVVVTEPAGAGPAEARNAGVASSSSELIAFVDADVVVEGHALERLRAAFAAEPGLAAVFGSYDDAPAAPGTVSRFRNLLHHHVHVSSPGPAETFWAGLGAVRRDALRRGRPLRRRALRATLGRGHRAGHAPARGRGDDRARPRDPRHPPEALDAAVDGRHRPAAPGHPLDPAAAREPAGSVRGAQPGLAPPARARSRRSSRPLAAFARRPLVALAALAAMVAANLSFYRLLARRGGVGLALAGRPPAPGPPPDRGRGRDRRRASPICSTRRGGRPGERAAATRADRLRPARRARIRAGDRGHGADRAHRGRRPGPRPP